MALAHSLLLPHLRVVVVLQIRERQAELEPTLTSEEQAALAEADRVLVERAAAFYQALLRFLDFAAYRREHGIPPTRILRDLPRRERLAACPVIACSLLLPTQIPSPAVPPPLPCKPLDDQMVPWDPA